MHLLLAMVKPSVQRKRRAARLFKNVSEAKDEKVFEDDVKVIFNIRFTSNCYIQKRSFSILRNILWLNESLMKYSF